MSFGANKGVTYYNVRPVSYGTLTTEDAAKQISAESTATPADVKAVLDRYAYYVKENLKKGYDVELLGFGKLYVRFITGKSVTDKSKANANLIKVLVPGFRPSFTIDKNGKRTYDLLTDRLTLTKYTPEEEGANKTPSSNTGGGGTNKPSGDNSGKPSGDSGSTPSGGNTPGGSGSETPDGGDGNEEME